MHAEAVIAPLLTYHAWVAGPVTWHLRTKEPSKERGLPIPTRKLPHPPAGGYVLTLHSPAHARQW